VRRSCHRMLWGVCVMSVSAVGLFDAARRAEAIPAFARQFPDTKCSTCHTPLPPRLNNVGLVFRRMGFRLPDEEGGKLILKNIPAHNPFETTSLGTVLRVSDTKTRHGNFDFHEFKAISMGNLGDKAAYRVDFEFHSDEDPAEWEWEFGEAQYNVGTPERAFILRAGRMQSLLWQKGPRSLTIAPPLVFSKPGQHVVPAGSFAGFPLGDAVVGVELGGALNKLGTEGGEIRSTNASLSILNGVNEVGEPATAAQTNYRDLLAQIVHQWGTDNSIGALWYRGTGIGKDDPATAANESSRDRFNRYGIFGNYRLVSGTDLIGGYLRGSDHSSGPGGVGHSPSDGYYVEVDHGFGENSRAAAVLRWDHFTPNTHHSSSAAQGWTAGLIYQPHNNVILQLEFQRLRADGQSFTRDFTLQALLIY